MSNRHSDLGQHAASQTVCTRTRRAGSIGCRIRRLKRREFDVVRNRRSFARVFNTLGAYLIWTAVTQAAPAFTDTASNSGSGRFSFSVPEGKLSADDWIAASQIPKDVLVAMTTTELVKSCMSIPIRKIFVAHMPYEHGVDRLFSLCNGLAELEHREDAGRELIATYMSMDPAAIGKTSELIDKARLNVDFAFIELVLGRERIISSLSSAQIGELIKALIQRHPDRCQSVLMGSEIVDVLMCKLALALGERSREARSDTAVALALHIREARPWSPQFETDVMAYAKEAVRHLTTAEDSGDDNE